MVDYTKEELADMAKKVSQTPEFKKLIENEVKKNLKSGETEKTILDVSSNVLTQLFKALWQKRSFWKSSLSNKPN